MERLGIGRWPVVMPAIKGCFLSVADHSLWNKRIRDCVKRLRVGGEHSAFKVQVFKARPAVAMRDRR